MHHHRCCCLASLVVLLASSSSSQIANSTNGAILWTENAAHAGGTVVVALALSDGLILAADSRQTVVFEDGTKPSYKIVSDSANKLFAVGRTGISTYGVAFILGRSIESYVSEYKTQAQAVKADDVREVAKGFTEYFGKYYDQHVNEKKESPALGFLFAGYAKDGIGILLEVDFPNQKHPFDLNQSTHNPGAAWKGQTEVITRLIKGFDEGLIHLPSLLKLPQANQEAVAKDIAGLEYAIPFTYLSLQDGIDLALSLVQSTVDMQRFTFGTSSHLGAIPGVGGAVDVLAITPTELSWVRKKQLTVSAK